MRLCTRRHPASFCMSLRPCTRAHLPTFCMSLRGAGQPPRDVAIRFSLQWGRTRSNTLGEYEKHYEFAMAARSCTRRHLPVFSMSLRGAKRRGNPLLLRQHITKSNTLGKYGKAANLPWQHVLAHADTRQVIAYHCVLAPAHTCPPSACHCEERGSRPATWQSVLLAVGHDREQLFPANT